MYAFVTYGQEHRIRTDCVYTRAETDALAYAHANADVDNHASPDTRQVERAVARADKDRGKDTDKRVDADTDQGRGASKDADR